MNIGTLDLTPSKNTENEHRVIVRISTSYWSDNNGIYSRKSIKKLKRKSFGYDPLGEEIFASGAEDTWKTFLNLDGLNDGIYEMIPSYVGGQTYDGDWDGYCEFNFVEYKDEI